VTAGVVVMNASAVALAADSAVTIPYRSGVKHYRGANKLVGFHAEAPVAASWFGSPGYLGVPWEVILKDFRTADSSLQDDVSGYVTALFAFTDDEARKWELTAGGEPPAAELARPLFEQVRRALLVRAADPVRGTRQAIDEWEAALHPRRRVLSDDVVDGYEPLQTWLDGELEALADELGRLPSGVRAALREAARSAWTHLSPREPLHTGLVVAGFGERQRLPGLCFTYIGVPIGDHSRRATRDQVTVNADLPAVVVPFAVNDQVRLFMEGITPELRKWLTGVLKELGEVHGLPAKDVDRLKRLLDDRINEHSQAVINAVRFLPKADLAEFARQMVAFTAFRLRMSMAAETVGEPIDVAVISRSEGVVWVHRNHYFPPELNPRFLAQYR
jgi:hypothetical protein